jgi:hypothetical protein
MTLTVNAVLDLCLTYVTCVQNLCVGWSYLRVDKVVSVLYSSFGHNDLVMTLPFSSIFVNIFRL